MSSEIYQRLDIIEKNLTRILELLTEAAQKQPKKKPRTPFPVDFAPSSKHFEWAQEHGYLNPYWVHQQVERMKAWALAKGELKADWNQTLMVFMQKAIDPPWRTAAPNGNQPRKLGRNAKRV